MSERITLSLWNPQQAHSAIAHAWTQAKALLMYSPESGEIRWKVRVSQRVKAGDVAGSITHKGYREIKVCGKTIGAHRLAWFLGTGKVPEQEIDHINGDRSDNRLCNLREAGRAMNMQNLRVAPSHNRSSGILGVSMNRHGTWVAHIKINGRQRHLGTFKTAEDAHQAYILAKREHHAGCTL